MLFDAHMPSTTSPIAPTGRPGPPSRPPRRAFALARSGARATVYASWNGATDVASWRVLAGPAKTSLSPAGAAPRSGFETAIALAAAPAKGSYVSVQALSATGAVLGASPARRVLTWRRSRGAGPPSPWETSPTMLSTLALRRTVAFAAAERAVEK